MLLLIDSTMGSMVLPPSRATVFDIICCFGGYNPVLSILVATLGSSLGGTVNWILGRLVILARMKYHKSEYSDPNRHLQSVLLVHLALLSWTHIVGSLINVLCGYLRVGIVRTYLAVFTSHVVHSTYCAVLSKFLNLW